METSPMHITQSGVTPARLLSWFTATRRADRAEGGRHFARQESLAFRGWQIVVPDRPGHGLSPAPSSPNGTAARTVD